MTFKDVLKKIGNVAFGATPVGQVVQGYKTLTTQTIPQAQSYIQNNPTSPISTGLAGVQKGIQQVPKLAQQGLNSFQANIYNNPNLPTQINKAIDQIPQPTFTPFGLNSSPINVIKPVAKFAVTSLLRPPEERMQRIASDKKTPDQLIASIKDPNSFESQQAFAMGANIMPVAATKHLFSNETLKYAQQQLSDPQARKLVQEFATIIEKNPNANKKNLGWLGDYIQSLGEELFGTKEAANMTNKQLKNAIDLVWQEADKFNGGTAYIPKIRIGSSIEDVRKPQSTKVVPQTQLSEQTLVPQTGQTPCTLR